MDQTQRQKNRAKFRRLVAYFGFAGKKRLAMTQTRLALETLEPRSLLSVSPFPGANSSNGHDRATDSQLGQHRPAAEIQPVSQHDRIENNHQPRGRDRGPTASDRAVPPPNPQTYGLPPASSQAASPSLPQLPPPLLAGPILTFTNPPLQNRIAETASSPPVTGAGGTSSQVEVSTSLTNLQTDLFAGALPTPMAEGESPVSVPNLGSTDQGKTVVDPNTAPTPSDLAVRDAFMSLGTADLVELDTLIDEIAAGRRLTLDFDSEASSAAVFSAQSAIDDSSLDDGSSSDLRETMKSRPFRDGFIDIAELVDELFAESSARRQGVESDPAEFTDADDQESAATAVNQAGSRSADILSEYRLNRTIDETSGRSAAASSEASTLQGVREGMIELAHDGNSPVGASAGRDAEVQMPAFADASFLKMDGPVARYQAFEMAPPADVETPPQSETPPRGQPSPEMASHEARDRGPHALAPTSIASVLFALFFRRRSRRRAAPTA